MASVNLASEPFRITRLELARTGALQYIKTFWFILAGVPIAGILLLIFMPSKFGIAFGLLFLAWPLTIPGRVALVSWQKGNLLLKPTIAEITPNAILLRDEDSGKGIRVPNDWIRKVWTYADLYVIEGQRFKFVMLRKSAFPDGHEKVWPALQAKSLFGRSRTPSENGS